jgi:hypothetical protein
VDKLANGVQMELEGARPFSVFGRKPSLLLQIILANFHSGNRRIQNEQNFFVNFLTFLLSDFYFF